MIVDDARKSSAGAHLEPPLPEARLARQWAAIAERRARSRARHAAPFALAAVLAAALALVLVLRRAPEMPFEGAALETAASAGHTWTMPGGAEVKLASETRLVVTSWAPARVVLTLERGEARFDLPHVDGRSWMIRAGRFDVRVVGTQFKVTRGEGDDLAVEVTRGRVEVASHDDPKDVRALGPGESWHAGGVVAAAAPADVVPSARPSPELPPPTSTEADAPVEEPAAAALPPPPSWEALARAKQWTEAYDALGPDGFRAATSSASAEKLFRLAEVARAARHLRDAELAFDTLRRRHRGDARASLAAFELGRMRMDSLGNPAGAAEALADAIQLAPGAPFREDAEARRVTALSATGATAACEAARAAYLARYPTGAHAAVVASRCAPGRR